MDGDSANLFINTIVKNIQMLCHGHLSFNQNVEVIGHLYLNIDSDKKLNYIVNEKCIKVNASTTFTSNSFHAEPGNMVQSEQNKYTKAIGGPTPKNVQNKSRKQKSTPIKPEKSPKLIKLSESFEDSETPIDCNIDNSLGVTFSQDTISENPLDLPSLTPDTSIVKTEAEEADEDFYHIEENENDNDTSLDGGGTNDMLYSSSSLPTLPILPTHSPSGSQQYSSAAVDDYNFHCANSDHIFSVSGFTAEEILNPKNTSTQKLLSCIIKQAAIESGMWDGTPYPRDIPPRQRMQFFSAVLSLAPQLAQHKDFLWTKLGQRLKDRRFKLRKTKKFLNLGQNTSSEDKSPDNILVYSKTVEKSSLLKRALLNMDNETIEKHSTEIQPTKPPSSNNQLDNMHIKLEVVSDDDLPVV